MKYVKKATPEKFPVIKNTRHKTGGTTLVIELTERCNNNCIHCYINLPADDEKAKNRELSTDEIFSILKEAVDIGYLGVWFTGGEPLLREDFIEVYLFARRLGMYVIIFTNATLITPKIADILKKVPPLMPIEISIYGMQASSYETVTRNPGSFEAAIRGVRLLAERKIPFLVKGTILPPNKHEIEEFERWAMKVTRTNISPLFTLDLDLRARRDSPQKNRMIKKLRVQPVEYLKLVTRKKEEYLNEMAQFCQIFTRPCGNKLFSCGAGNGGAIDAYGNLQLCMTLRHPDTVYSLKRNEASLKKGIDEFFPEILKLKAKNPSYLNRCGNCFLKGLCKQCPAKSWMEYGTLDTPVEYLCEITQVQARFLGLISTKEKPWEVKDWKERIKRLAGSIVKNRRT